MVCLLTMMKKLQAIAYCLCISTGRGNSIVRFLIHTISWLACLPVYTIGSSISFSTVCSELWWDVLNDCSCWTNLSVGGLGKIQGKHADWGLVTLGFTHNLSWERAAGTFASWSHQRHNAYLTLFMDWENRERIPWLFLLHEMRCLHVRQGCNYV